MPINNTIQKARISDERKEARRERERLRAQERRDLAKRRGW